MVLQINTIAWQDFSVIIIILSNVFTAIRGNLLHGILAHSSNVVRYPDHTTTECKSPINFGRFHDRCIRRPIGKKGILANLFNKTEKKYHKPWLASRRFLVNLLA